MKRKMKDRRSDRLDKFRMKKEKKSGEKRDEEEPWRTNMNKSIRESARSSVEAEKRDIEKLGYTWAATPSCLQPCTGIPPKGTL